MADCLFHVSRKLAGKVITVLTCVYLYMSQLLVNCSVFCVVRNKTILPWTIQQIQDIELSFSEFFKQRVEGRICDVPVDLVSACAGNSKESLDEVDLSLHIQPVVIQFGHFVKYNIRSHLSEVNSHCVAAESNTQLDIGGYFPNERIPVHNNKDTLFKEY